TFHSFAKTNIAPTSSWSRGRTTASGKNDSLLPSNDARKRSSSPVETLSPNFSFKTSVAFEYFTSKFRHNPSQKSTNFVTPSFFVAPFVQPPSFRVFRG